MTINGMALSNGGRMRRWIRIAVATAGLMAAGGIFGTIAGTLVLLVWMAAREPFHFTLAGLDVLVFLGVFFGGIPGAVLGPLAAWVLMRHVPLWLAFAGTTLGTVASGGLVALITGNPTFAILSGAVGMFASAAALNDRYPGKEPRRIESGTGVPACAVSRGG
jgi:hypothetical protein